MPRLFFALWPPSRSSAALAGWAKRLGAGRATRAETVHLTLAFLGEIGEERIESACAAAQRVRFAAFALPLEQVRYWKHNRVVWASPSETPAPLAALATDLAAGLRAARFALDGRAFAAHVTLARGASPPSVLPPVPRLDWPVREFVLVRSRPSRKGSAYEIVRRFPAA